ncbi:SAM-dependent methyltransferase [Sphingomonas naasensis]|uniref:Class I SAM-dependent methyltransferase n=1 Tax=Sphingomonas naasensis TaxID=1344951 RepID=A0A4S1WCS5_9SPHN|nr:class I SAM-dependent methyltransferase [Sphingomonas naasensis]NIJ22218.1 SAM-dependent methyltransferase [Sphingomonas naasensis]TGX40761.1 class I SAM-dependent methyltransferase [Sphingomonas naasensis]
MRAAPELFLHAQNLARTGRLDEARAAYARSLDAHPDFLPGYLALSGLAAHLGDAAAAIAVLRAALARAEGNAAARHAIRRPLAGLLASLRPTAWDARLAADLRACLADEQLDPQPLAGVTAALLRHADAADPLWPIFLTRCINTDPAIEARLVVLRDARIGAGDAHDPLVPALACQAHANQYVWPAPEAAPDGLLRALVAPPSELPDDPAWQPLARHLEDSVIELGLAAAIPSFSDPAADVSIKVRRQYEAHPYPRWQAPPASRRTDFAAHLAALPGIDRAALPPAPLRLLVAGCGTGFEAIDMARIDASLSVTAVDLSRASLAFAQRKADALGIANIRFVQGDILALDRLGETFDVATSTGVLHHMADPDAGLASIVGVLRRGGVVRLALYSHRARAPVRAAHARIAERGWQADADGIRAFRAHILSLPADDPLAVLRESDDFYSLSGCRDLVFHAHERHYRWPEIAALIAGAGLRLIGLDASPEAITRFGAMHGAAADVRDLALWAALEAEHPFLFAGMIALWCQKL